MKFKVVVLWVEFYSYGYKYTNEHSYYIIMIRQNFTGRLLNLKEQIRNKGIHPLVCVR